MKKINVIVVALLICFLSYTQVGYAQGGIGELILGSFLDSIDVRVNQWMQNAFTSANNLSNDIIFQLATRVDSLRRELNQNLKQRIDQLSGNMQNALNQLNIVTNEIEEKVVKDFDRLTVDLIIRIRGTLAQTIIGGDFFKPELIDGTLIPFDAPASHKLSIKGNGFGFNSSKLKNSHELTIILNKTDKYSIKGTSISGTDTDFYMDVSNFDLLRNAEKATKIEAELTSVIEKKRLFDWKKYIYKTPIAIVLSPDLAGTYNLRIRTGRYDWRDSPGDNVSQTKTSGNGSPGNDYIMPFEFEVSPFSIPPYIGCLQFVSAAETACAGPCHGWRKYEPIPHVKDYGKKVGAVHRNWGDPVTVTITGFVQKYMKIEDINNTVNNIKYYFSRNEVIVALPEGFLGVTMDGRTTDGMKFTMAFDRDTPRDVPPIPSTIGTPFQYLTNSNENQQRIYRFKIIKRANR